MAERIRSVGIIRGTAVGGLIALVVAFTDRANPTIDTLQDEPDSETAIRLYNDVMETGGYTLDKSTDKPDTFELIVKDSGFRISHPKYLLAHARARFARGNCAIGTITPKQNDVGEVIGFTIRANNGCAPVEPKQVLPTRVGFRELALPTVSKDEKYWSD